MTDQLRVALSLVALAACWAPALATGGEDLGRKVYNRNCYFCHGYAGDGKTAAAQVLVPRPRDFTALRLPRARMLDAVRKGRPGTAMQPFEGVLGAVEIEAVIEFIDRSFMRAREANLSYHSPVNGWAGDPRKSPAARFVTGARQLGEDWETLDAPARRGRQIYLSACISCHLPAPDAGSEHGLTWRNQAVTYPAGNYVEDEDGPDPVTAVFAGHESVPPAPLDGPAARRGQILYQTNCAHCHAADGTGRNWVGSFLEPPPRDLAGPGTGATPTRAELLALIRNGVANTAMPAWRQVLTEAEIESIVDYMRSVFRRFSQL